MMQFKHYILTSFAYGNNYPYLKERFKIFHNFTKPSIEAQTNKNFTWVIQTNPSHKHLFEPFNNIDVIFISSKPSPFQVPTDYLITTRIDCDDAFHQDFVKTIQEEFIKDQSTRIIDGPGHRYISKTKEVYTYYDRYHEKKPSPFSTLVSPFKDKLTVLCEQHGRLAKRFKVQFHNKKLWLQHIHDHNKLMTGVGEEKINLDLTEYNINL